VRPPFLRRAVGAAVALGLVVPGFAATPAAAKASDPLGAAQSRVVEATKAANAAIAEFQAAESRHFATQEEAAATRREIGRLRAEQQRLVKLARLRAVTAYKGGGGAIDDFMGGLDDGDVMDAARRATLLDRVNARGNQAIALLGRVTSDLHAREAALRKELREQAEALAELKEQEQAAIAALEEARRAEQQLRERLAAEKRAAEYAAMVAAARARARAEAERAANSSGGGAVGQIIGSGSWVCPVQGGPLAFRNDWGDPRSGGRTHKGTDMFAPRGTPVVAVLAGSVFFQGDRLGGNAAYVSASDGNTYYYAHLNDYVGGARSVSAGEVIGHVGTTGTFDSPPHLHFEIRIGGPNGTKVNPYPTLAARC
jgi:murein DD-endopeptidase MepM/ murein hydrolase activator NlpD